MSDPKESNRRRFKRVQAPVFCRPMGRPLFAQKSQAIDISQGGLRIYSDEKMAPGERLELELFLPDESTITCEVEIVWIDELPKGAPALFDMGLKFIEPDEVEQERLAAVLEGVPTSSA